MTSLLQKIKNVLHIAEAFIADLIFLFPGKKITVIGITGTDGKTTTVHMLYHILMFANKKASMVSSVCAKIGKKTYQTGFHTTTPRPFMVRKMLCEAVAGKQTFFILETTSHALVQNRVWGIPFYIGVLTNITQEHDFFHKSFDNYLAAKIKLLKASKFALINHNMENLKKVKKCLHDLKIDFNTYSYCHGVKSDFVLDNQLEAIFEQDFMKENLSAAAASAQILGISKKTIKKALEVFHLPEGRCFVLNSRDFRIIIDFAHTPGSLKRILSYVRKKYTAGRKGRLIHVFGAASQRDDIKRPMMGQISSEYADVIILTEEDHRQEDIGKINSQIISGIKNYKEIQIDKLNKLSQKVFVQIDNRAEAIKKAVQIAEKGDVLILTGKGHEKSLNRYGREYPWDEKKIVKQALKLRSKQKRT